MRLCRPALAALVAVSVACSSAYTPRRGPQLKLTMEGGQPMVVKSGVYTPMGLFGGGLVEAVADNPAALEHAEAYRDGSVSGLLTALGGALAMGLSPLALATDANARGPSERAVRTTIGVAVAGLVAYAVGLGMVVNAQPRMFDAINRYNDDLEVAALPTAATPP